jgi:hypothetical protein
MMNTEDLKTLGLALSWCDEELALLGEEMRPLSLGSRHLLRLMGTRMLDLDPGYESEEGEARDLTLFAWLHSSPLAEVTEAMWSGAWRALLESGGMDEATRAAVLPEWRERRLRLAVLCAAVDYEVAPRPRSTTGTSSAPQPPVDLMNPTRLAHRVWLLMRETRVSRAEALWEFPYWQAMQVCHAAQRHEGDWTVPVRERTGPGSFEEFDLSEETERSEEGDQRSERNADAPTADL